MAEMTGNQKKQRRQLGMSLIELGLVMVIVSLALAPVVRMMGGPSTDQGSAVQIIGEKSKEIILANSIIEKALAADYSMFTCSGSFDPKTGFPASNTSKSLPAARCENDTYNQPLFYQWTVRNMDPTGQEIPTGNHYYTAVLNIWDSATSTQPLLSLPTGFYWSEGGVINNNGKTGVMVALDQSGSMAYGKTRNYPAPDGNEITRVEVPAYQARRAPANQGTIYMMTRCTHGKYPASPYLKYRNNGSSTDDQLDIATFFSSDDPATPWYDQYAQNGILGMTNCGLDTSAYFDFSDPKTDASTGTSGSRSHAQTLCNLTAATNSAAWSTALDTHLSRMEVARSSLLSFLVAMEGNSDLYQNSKIGFLTFSSDIQVRVPLEEANSSGKFVQSRKKFTWINRSNGSASATGTADGPINPDNDTDVYTGVKTAAQKLFADTTLNSRIILLVGDGRPECASFCQDAGVSGYNVTDCTDYSQHSTFQALGTSIGNGTFAGSNGNKATIFAMGLMSDDPDMATILGTDLATRTPGGQYFAANSITQVQPIFDQIQYQIQRLILLNRANRFNVDFS